MIEFAGASFLVLAFVALLKLLRVVERSQQVVAISKGAVSDLANSALNDDQKEKAMRARSKSLGFHFLFLALGVAIAIFAPVGLIWALDLVGFLSFGEVMATVVTWEFIIGGSLLMILVFWRSGRQRKGV